MIAVYLGMDRIAFVQQYTRLTADRRSLSLIEHNDGSCIFLEDDNRCRINPVKPKQCRDFPVRWNFPGFEKLCKGDIVRTSVEDTGEKDSTFAVQMRVR